MLTAEAIQFEVALAPAELPAARMDVACFIGFLKAHAEADYDTPVHARSLAELESVFDLGARLEKAARVDGDAIALPAPAGTLHMAVNEVLETLDLPPAPDLASLTAAITDADIGVIAEANDSGGISLSLPVAAGVGTFAVLPSASYGFPTVRRAVARATPSPMALALRHYFEGGGVHAVVISMGEPLPYDTPRSDRFAALVHLLVREVAPNEERYAAADTLAALGLTVPLPTVGPGERTRLAHIHGLTGVTFLLAPDLTELVAEPPTLRAVPPPALTPSGTFAECLPPPTVAGDTAQSSYTAPQCDTVGSALWDAAVDRLVRLVSGHRRDMMVLAALPRTRSDALPPTIPRSAFLHVAAPFVVTPASRAAPERLMAPDAALAAHLAAAALEVGTFRSAAARPVLGLTDVATTPRTANAPTCRLTRVPAGFALTQDVNTADNPRWRDGPVARIFCLILRQSARVGEGIVFQPNGPALWRDLRAAMTTLLERIRLSGALAGSGPGDSYTVACGPETMTQADIDDGRLACDITITPAVPVSRIRVRLPMGSAALSRGEGGPA
ncbi:MAG: hypothetical protein AAF580_06800 [Pseudomonadota bacterium]